MAALGLAAAILLVPGAGAGRAQVAAGPAAFSGTASALGMELKLQIPGFPATDVPVDAGGPTAQAAADSLGSSTGYAALPDPGQFVTTIPGLVTGLLASGAAGFPPVHLPPLPNYPLFVQSDVNSAPNASFGAGPYQLSAKSAQGSSQASGVGGLQTGILGNVGAPG
jgi:hypothetical protein